MYTVASFKKFFLKQESMITEQHLQLGKASFNIYFDTYM